MKRMALLLAMAATCAGLARDAGAVGPSVDAERARELTIGLDLDAARAVLAKADTNNPEIGLERARLALYDGDCDAAAAILAEPQVAQLDQDEFAGRYDAGLGDIARGCARTTAATVLEEDKAHDIWIRFEDVADRALMPLLVDTIVKARDSLTRDLGVDWPKPTRVVVVRDLRGLSDMTGLPYESATTTGTVGIAKWGRVTLLSPRASQHGFAWRDTLAHELTHLAVTHASGDRAPLWLQEGLAKREEIRWRGPSPFDDRPSPESVVAYGIEKHLDLPLDKLGPSIAMLPSADQAMVAFAEVTSFVRYLAAQSGDQAVRQLLAALRAGSKIDAALSAATGADLKGWDGRWRAHLATLGAVPPAALTFAATKDAVTMREKVRLAELLIGRGHENDAATELDAVSGAMLSDPNVRYLKARALEKTNADDARRALGEPAEVFMAYAPWWAIRGRLASDPGERTTDFAEAIAQDPFDVDAACADPSSPLCEAAKANGAPDVGRE
jgi:hypothetical protein